MTPEPLLEERVKAVTYEFGIRSEIYGKGAEMPRAGDLLIEDVKVAMFKVFLSVKFERLTIPRIDIAKRAPTLCPSCLHKASIFELKSVFGEDTIYASAARLEEKVPLESFTVAIREAIRKPEGNLLAFKLGFTLVRGGYSVAP